MKIPKLLQAVLVWVFVFAAFKITFDVILGQLIPNSLLTMYMFFVTAGIFMVFTASEEGARELAAPIKALVEDPGKKMMRNIVFIVVPLLAGAFTYSKMLPSFEAPLELRSIHPAPPKAIKAYGKRYDLTTLENPYRKFEKEDPAKFKELVKEGGAVYVKNCQWCHGD